MSPDTSHELKIQLRVMQSKLRRKEDENKRLREALRVLLAQNESSEDLSDDDASDENMDDNGEDHGDQDMDAIEDDDQLPEAIQSSEFKDVWVCSDSECMGEVVDDICHFCGQEHQPLEDEFAIRAISTESQTDHPDRTIAPRGVTPTREIDLQTPIPAEYESREKEFLELLRRGATPLMCCKFSLVFTPERGICASANEQIFEDFAGPAMDEEDTWQIYLGRQVTLEEGDVDGEDFITDLLDDISTLPAGGNWVTEEEYPGEWVTYPKYRGEIETWPTDKIDLVEDLDEEEEPPVYDNDYDISDDDEPANLETDDPSLLIYASAVDLWYPSDDSDCLSNNGTDTGLDDDDRDSEMTYEETSACSTVSESDSVGSNIDSNPILNGDKTLGPVSGTL